MITDEKIKLWLSEILNGCQITGVDIIDYPATDGVLLYLNRDGQNYILETGFDPFIWAEDEPGNPFHLTIDLIEQTLPDNPEEWPVYGTRMFDLPTQ